MPSFDVVNKLDQMEVDNAIAQAKKEIAQRFDFKNTQTSLEKTDEGIVLVSINEARLDVAWFVLQERLVKRKVPVGSFERMRPEPAAKQTMRQLVKMHEGIVEEKAKAIIKAIKELKLKVQAQIMGDQLRVTGKNRDDLQACIQALRAGEFGVALQFINMRD